jgi:hypothetical protein
MITTETIFDFFPQSRAGADFLHANSFLIIYHHASHYPTIGISHETFAKEFARFISPVVFGGVKPDNEGKRGKGSINL